MVSIAFLFRQLTAFFAAFLIVVAVIGCVVVPTSTEGGFGKKEELIQSLIGTSTTDVRSQLGEPIKAYELPEVAYLLYERRGKQDWFSLAHPLAIIWYQLPVGWGTTNLLQCLLIESRDDKVVHAEIKSDSDLTGAALHLTPTNKSCPSLFWRKDEIERIEMAAKNYRQENLIALAEKGNAEAAIALAREFKELRYLRELVARGDREAIFVLARVGDVAPLRELAALGDRDAVSVLAHELEDLASIRELAKAGDLRAAATLARKHGEKEPLYDLAERGNVNAAVELAERDGYKKPLYDLAEKGNVDAAIKLAQFFDERRPLTQLAKSGDSEAVSALQNIDCRRVYYRARNSTIEHASDKFVPVCEGRELSDKKTIKIYRDWGAEEGLHYRIYFETTPISLQ